MKLNLTLAKVDVLRKFHPEWVDGGPGQPGDPVWGTALLHGALAGIVRDVAARLSDAELQRQVGALGKRLAASAASGFVNGWEEGDDLCPPWPWPHPWPWTTGEDPSPLPWIESAPAGLRDLMSAAALAELAALTPDRDMNQSLRNAAKAVFRAAAGDARLTDEFDEWCATRKPRKAPKPRKPVLKVA